MSNSYWGKQQLALRSSICSNDSSALKDFRLYLFCVIYSGLSLSLAVMSIFLPTIVGELGYHSVYANLMTVPIYACAYIMLLITAYFSDRFQQRGLPVMLGGLISGLGYVLLGVLRADKARFGMTFLAATVGSASHHVLIQDANDI